MSQSLIIKLKSYYPNSIIDVIIRPDIEKLVNLMPQINSTYILDVNHGKFGLFERISLANKLKNNKYTTSFILQNSFKSSLIPWLANIPERIGYLTEFRYFLINRTTDWSVNLLFVIDGPFENLLNIGPDLILEISNHFLRFITGQ